MLSIERPEAYNALNREIISELDSCLSELGPDVRVLLIHSEKNFAAGADIRQMVTCTEEEAKNFCFASTYNKLASLKIPTIAAIDGYALGGGLELALCCDIRYASARAKVGFPEINLGIMPGGGGTVRAPRCIGYGAALELILSGQTVSAERALELGLVDHVVAEGELLDAAMSLAKKLAQKPPIAVQTAKATVRAAMQIADPQEAALFEAAQWAGLFNTADQKEGMKAFIEKRPAQFTGT